MSLRATVAQGLSVLLCALLLNTICHAVPTASASLSQNEIVDYIKNLRLAEVQSLIAELERELGVKASASVVVVGPSGPAAPVAPVEEQTEFDVILREVGPNKLNVIKAVRMLSPLGLKEAKDLVERAPTVVKAGVSKDEAAAARRELEAAGAVVEIR